MTRTRTLPLLAVLALAVTGCSASMASGEAGLEYNDGPFQDHQFTNCIKPGARDYLGPDDDVYRYRAGQRTFEFASSEGADYGALTAASKDNTTMTIEGLATFSLNTDCKVLQQFHEQIGESKEVFIDGGGWDEFLDEYLGQQLDKAVDVASKSYDYLDLYTNKGGIKEEWEDTVGTLAAQYVEDAAGGAFICAPDYDPDAEDSECGSLTLTLQAPTPPDEVIAALNDISAAKQEAAAQEERNKTQKTGATGLRESLKDLGLPITSDSLRAYSLYLAVTENGASILGADVIAPAPAEEPTP